MRMRLCHWICASIHQQVPLGTQQYINNVSGLAILAFVRVHAQLFNAHSIETYVGNYHSTVVYAKKLLQTINRAE